MSVPRTFPALLRLGLARVVCLSYAGVALAVLSALVSVSLHAKGPEVPQRLPLQPMGYQPQGAGSMASTTSLSTVNFIDDQHLLITFAVRRLMKRLPDDPVDDEDRTVEAVVVHLSSGKVLARTSWRLHDTAQYLWNLGNGRFLLRMRNVLTTFMPLENLPHGDPFVEQPLLVSNRKLAAVLLSPDRDLVTVETVQPPPHSTDETSPAYEPTSPEARRAQLNFYRMLQPAQPGEKVTLRYAGVAVAPGLVNLSITSAGYIEVLQESPTRWLFDFDPYGGKFKELSPVDSSCRPRPVFVSSSEFVALGCRGSEDKLMMGGFNMRGEQMWQQNFTDAHAFPNFAFAPGAGRFALSRNIVAATAGITVDFAPSAFTSQEIRVYQTHNGRQLLRVEATPVQRAGQNYDLSPDGLRLGVIRDGAVEVYRLPPLVPADEAAIRVARAMQPENSEAIVSLASHTRPAESRPAQPKLAESHQAAQVSVAPADAPPTPSAPSSSTETNSSSEARTPPAVGKASAAGDEQPADGPRKPPTLYTLPTDRPEASHP